jgi:membrane protease YdiL (CAAX protease family)
VQSPPEDEPGSGPGDWKILGVSLDSEPPAAIPTEEDRLPDPAWVPGPPPGGPPSGPPGGRIFSLEGRPAAGLYLVAWLFALGGVALLFIRSLGDPNGSGGFRFALGLAGVAALTIGLAAGAGYQVVARSTRDPGWYRGPSPVLCFFLVLPVSTILSLLIGLVGIDVGPGNAVGFLLGLLAVGAGYASVVWAFVVRTGALSWSEMGWPRRSSVAYALNAIGLAVAVMLPATFAVLVFGGIVATLLGGVHAPDVLPPARSQLDAVAVGLAAAVVAPIGEELFFRGFAVTAWLRDLGPRRALIRGALFFAAVHVLNIQSTTFEVGAKQAVLVLAEIMPLGFVLGWLFLQRGILASIAGHVAYNSILLLLPIVLESSTRVSG